MRIQFNVGNTDFYGVSFDQFDDYPAFSAIWAAKIVPGRALLTSWDHVGQSWSRPVGRKKLKIAPGIQCFQLDPFGQRVGDAEAARLSRILNGLGVTLPELKEAVDKTVPASVFTFDATDAVPEPARRAESWQVFGEAQFEHFVLRFPTARVGDWALLSVATDFVLSRRRIGRDFQISETAPATSRTRVAPGASTPSAKALPVTGQGTLADRVFDMMSGSRRLGAVQRPH